MSTFSSAVSIIVPTFREAPNVKPLVARVFAAVREAGYDAELILVDDDSQDGTEAIVEELSAEYPVRLIVRRKERGLSGAVLAGFREAVHDRFVVLDADLQHPPEMIPALLLRLGEGDCDFVIGSRYDAAGEICGQWPLLRRIGSRLATLLARPLMPLSDPMSGFFALSRETWERAENVNPIGYKIALELYVKGNCERPAEVPIKFDTRAAGESKLSLAEQFRYIRHLGRLYRFRFPAASWFVTVAALIVIVLVALWVWPAIVALTGT